MTPTIEQCFLQVREQAGQWSARITAATKSVLPVDTDEIVAWFTGSEKELTIRCDPFNLFFHTLPSGHYALGIIYPLEPTARRDSKGRDGLLCRILIISPQCLFDSGNHPVTLFETLRSQNLIPLVTQPPAQLSPLTLSPLPLNINTSLLDNLVDHLGAMALAQLMQSLFTAECTLFTSKSVSALPVLSALFDLLPIRYRPEITFSSDFFLSPNNSFRLSGFSQLQPRTIRLMKQWGVPVISLEQGNKGSLETLDPWPRFVYQLLQSRNFDFWNRHWNIEPHGDTVAGSRELPSIMWDNLHEVGVLLSKAMSSMKEPGTPAQLISATDLPGHTLEELRCMSAVEQMIPMFSGSNRSAYTPRSWAGDQRLGERFPQFQEELSELEVYLVRGMFGDESAVPQIRRIWTQLTPQLQPETKETLQEAIVSTIHAVLTSLEGNSEQRLHRSTQLLQLMVFFLQEPSGFC